MVPWLSRYDACVHAPHGERRRRGLRPGEPLDDRHVALGLALPGRIADDVPHAGDRRLAAERIVGEGKDRAAMPSASPGS